MNENLNLVKILEDCPKGTKLYSTVYGEVEFDGIENGKEYPVWYVNSEGKEQSVTARGLLFSHLDGDCTLFPSKEQRDWSKFKQLVKPKFKIGDKIVNIRGKNIWTLSGSQCIISEITFDRYIFTDGSYTFISNQDNWELVPDKKPKFDPKTLQPFDKVLVKKGDKSYHVWFPDFISLPPNDVDETILCMTIDDVVMAIPYNEETKCLAGTNKEAPEFYRYWEN